MTPHIHIRIRWRNQKPHREGKCHITAGFFPSDTPRLLLQGTCLPLASFKFKKKVLNTYKSHFFSIFFPSILFQIPPIINNPRSSLWSWECIIYSLGKCESMAPRELSQHRNASSPQQLLSHVSDLQSCCRLFHSLNMSTVTLLLLLLLGHRSCCHSSDVTSYFLMLLGCCVSCPLLGLGRYESRIGFDSPVFFGACADSRHLAGS